LQIGDLEECSTEKKKGLGTTSAEKKTRYIEKDKQFNATIVLEVGPGGKPSATLNVSLTGQKKEKKARRGTRRGGERPRGVALSQID